MHLLSQYSWFHHFLMHRTLSNKSPKICFYHKEFFMTDISTLWNVSNFILSMLCRKLSILMPFNCVLVFPSIIKGNIAAFTELHFSKFSKYLLYFPPSSDHFTLFLTIEPDISVFTIQSIIYCVSFVSFNIDILLLGLSFSANFFQ